MGEKRNHDVLTREDLSQMLERIVGLNECCPILRFGVLRPCRQGDFEDTILV